VSVVPNILIAVPGKKKQLPLSVTHPELAKEADGWDPSIWINDRNNKMGWICPNGHEYSSYIKDRRSGSGCPICGKGKGGKKVEPGVNDLFTLFPSVAFEAVGWDPKLFLPKSNKKKLWECKLGHRWLASPSERTAGKGCPYCSGHRAISGVTDLMTKFPEIATQAYGWNPREITASSGRKLDWKCANNHIWQAAVYSRTNGNGCPYCAGKLPIVGETDLLTLSPLLAKDADGWDPRNFTKHSGKKVGWKCSKGHKSISTIENRQKSGCPYCSGKYPIKGENDLKTLFPVLAHQANGWNPEDYLPKSNQKKSWRCEHGHIWDAVISDRSNGNGCPFCSGRRVLTGINDLETVNPKLALQAYGWDPSKVSFGSDKKLLWKCDKGHSWEAAISSRSSGVGCPYCSNQKVLIGYNDLVSTHPELSREACGWNPETVTAGSSKATHLWKCKFGHSWKSNVKNRVKGQGCPTCANTGYDPNQDGFLYLLEHPNWLMFQIGITNNPHMRISSHKKLGWEPLEIRGPMDGHLTQQWETAVLRMLKAKGADLSNEKIAGKFDGYSEAWSKSTFEVTSIMELMRLTEEFEESKLED
jgi:hypothetical protein